MPVVVYDANVLYPSTLRDVLIRVGLARLVQPKWTDRILDEVFRNLRANRPDLDPARLDRTRRLMNDAIRDVTVTGYEQLIDQLDLPDADDRHVLAAAIHAEAQVIITFNLRDFPADRLSVWGVEAQHPDDFLTTLYQDQPDALVGTSQRSPWHGVTARDRQRGSTVSLSTHPTPSLSYDWRTGIVCSRSCPGIQVKRSEVRARSIVAWILQTSTNHSNRRDSSSHRSSRLDTSLSNAVIFAISEPRS